MRPRRTERHHAGHPRTRTDRSPLHSGHGTAHRPRPDIANAVLSAAGVARLVDNTALLAIELLEDIPDARPVKIAVGDATGVHWAVGIAEEIDQVLRQNGIETVTAHREIRIGDTEE